MMEENHSRLYTFSSEEIKLPLQMQITHNCEWRSKTIVQQHCVYGLICKGGGCLTSSAAGVMGLKSKIRTARAYEGIGKQCQRAHDNPKRQCLLGKGAGDTSDLQSPYMGYFNYVQAWKQLFWLTSSCMCGVGTLLAAVEHGQPQMRSQESAIYRDEDNDVMWCHMMSHDAIWLQ